VSGLGPGAEFDRIRAIAGALGGTAGPLDDDCALVQAGGTTLALSTDTSVERVHFRRDWLTPEEIGWRATAAALSDLAAEGASVIGVLSALSVPRDVPASDTTAIMKGVGDCVASCGGVVLGGDLTGGAQLSLTITVVGEVARPVRRSGASPGDRLWVTGTLGGARAALEALLTGGQPLAHLRERFARPVPRIQAGALFASLGATAMLDLSDGLAGDARHIAAASGVRVMVDLSHVPKAQGIPGGPLPPAVFAAQGGEDYELLATLPAGVDPRPAFEGIGLMVTDVGEVAAGEGAVFRLEGREVSLAGYDHFA